MTLQSLLIVNSVLEVLEGLRTLKDISATVSGAGKQEKCESIRYCTHLTHFLVGRHHQPLMTELKVKGKGKGVSVCVCVCVGGWVCKYRTDKWWGLE